MCTLIYLPDETNGDPALFKVTYIVDYEDQTFGFHDLEESELNEAEERSASSQRVVHRGLPVHANEHNL